MTRSRIRRGLLLPSVLLLGACGGGGGGGGGGAASAPAGPAPGRMHLLSAVVTGSLSEPAQVTVAGVADGDGAVDRAFSVGLPVSDPVSGSTDHAWEIVATDGAGNVRRARIALVIHP